MGAVLGCEVLIRVLAHSIPYLFENYFCLIPPPGGDQWPIRHHKFVLSAPGSRQCCVIRNLTLQSPQSWVQAGTSWANTEKQPGAATGLSSQELSVFSIGQIIAYKISIILSFSTLSIQLYCLISKHLLRTLQRILSKRGTTLWENTEDKNVNLLHF